MLKEQEKTKNLEAKNKVELIIEDIISGKIKPEELPKSIKTGVDFTKLNDKLLELLRRRISSEIKTDKLELKLEKSCTEEKCFNAKKDTIKCKDEHFLNSEDQCQAYTRCNLETEYVSKEGTNNQDRFCKKLSICKQTEYIKKKAGYDFDRVCAPLDVCEDFEEAEIPKKNKAGYFIENRECSLREKCEPTEYKNADTNFHCTKMTLCDPNSQYMSKGPDGDYNSQEYTSDRECKNYPNCSSGYYYSEGQKKCEVCSPPQGWDCPGGLGPKAVKRRNP